MNYKNSLGFIRVSWYHSNNRHPIVEFDRIYSSVWYEIDTKNRAARIQQLINDTDNELSTIHVRNNSLIVSISV